MLILFLTHSHKCSGLTCGASVSEKNDTVASILRNHSYLLRDHIWWWDQIRINITQENTLIPVHYLTTFLVMMNTLIWSNHHPMSSFCIINSLYILSYQCMTNGFSSFDICHSFVLFLWIPQMNEATNINNYYKELLYKAVLIRSMVAEWGQNLRSMK